MQEEYMRLLEAMPLKIGYEEEVKFEEAFMW
jgi:hypothetical protein